MTAEVDEPKPLCRVLIISPAAGLGGAERALLDFVASMRETQPDLRFHFLLLSEGLLSFEAERLGATVSLLSLPSQLRTLGDSGLLANRRWLSGLDVVASLALATPILGAFILKLRSEIRRLRPDIVHSNGMKGHLLSGLVVPRGIPLVWHMHDFLSERLIARSFLKLAARRANVAIAISEAVAKDTRKVLSSLPVVTILNAIDLDAFCPGQADGSMLDHLAGLAPSPPGTLRVGLIATYARWKGQDVFLRAAASVRALLPRRSVRFYVIGGPIYATRASQFSLEELNALVQSLELDGAVGLIPFQRAIEQVYRCLDIVVHASVLPEPFGRSILEAMACSKPVIISAAGGALELSRPDVTGLVHTPGNVDELAAAICELLRADGLRIRLGLSARDFAVRHFSHTRLGPSLLALYTALHRREAVPQ